MTDKAALAGLVAKSRHSYRGAIRRSLVYALPWAALGGKISEIEMYKTTIRCMAAVGLMLVFASPAWAQETVRVRGTIESVDGLVLAVRSRDGAALRVVLADNARVVGVVKASPADLKPGLFVGATGMPQADGSQKAVEVHIFPEAMRGTGEGHQPWDLRPQSTMTNGNVVQAQTITGIDGQTLTLKYKDGEKEIIVTPETAIVSYVLGDKSDLKPGVKIFISAATRLPDGTLQAPRVNFGKDGLVPPM